METIAGVKECEEAEVGAALRARDGAVSILSERAGIGPPDLCVVSKESTSLYGGRVQESTAFHYVLGLRCESAASVAAYFASLVGRQEPFGIMGIPGLLSQGTTQIKGGVYCAYDAFSRLDVRCFVTIPGNVVTVAVDGQGAEMEVDDGLWQNLVVSGFVRRVMMVSPADPIGHLDGR